MKPLEFKLVVSLLGQAREHLNKHSAPTQVLWFLRQVAKAYVAFLPGAGFLVDKVFDAINQSADTYAEEANVILNKVYHDFFAVIVKGGNENLIENTRAILAITQRLREEMKDLGIKSRQPAPSVPQQPKTEKYAATTSTAATDEIKGQSSAPLSNLYDEVENIIKSPSISIDPPLQETAKATACMVEKDPTSLADIFRKVVKHGAKL
jgi:hypothetical protein